MAANKMAFRMAEMGYIIFEIDSIYAKKDFWTSRFSFINGLKMETTGHTRV